MASHAPWSRHFTTIEGLVMKDGYSRNLTKGQFGIVDLNAAPTAKGLKVTTDLSKARNRKFELRMGVAPITPNRSQSNKTISSIPFKLSEVVDIRVNAPTEKGQSVDELIIGYDGINADTAIELNAGDSEVIDITLCGKAMGMLGYPDSKVTVKLYLEAPHEGDFTMQEIIRDAVERLKRTTLVGGVPITDYIKISPVDSTNPATITGTDYQYQRLTLADEGDYTALAKVQAQYPDYEIKREDYLEGKSTYILLAPDATEIDDYTTSLAAILKDCEDCPAGYTELEEGFVYQVNIEDSGEQEVTAETVEGISENVIEGTGERIAEDTYLVVTSAALSQAEIDAFVTANPDAIVELKSESVASLCQNTATTSTAWVVGETCTAIAETYTLQLRDTKCGDNRLAELQEAYPDLTIAVVAEDSNNCQTTYTTNVLTEVVCEECSQYVRDLFMSEAPQPFDSIDWKKAAEEYSADALMGIRLKGKENVFAGDEQFRDDIPFLYTSTRLSVAGGYPTTVSENFNAGRNGRFNVKLLSRASEPESIGGDFYDFEERARVYFDGRQRLEGNNYGKWVLGQETHLKPTAQYVDYIIRVETDRYAQSFSGKKEENFEFHVLAEVGRHFDVEEVVNALASAAGLEPVKAY